MQLFYLPDARNSDTLSREESYHCIKILRHKKGDILSITDGIGNLYSGKIISDDQSSCKLKILSKEKTITKNHNIHLVIAPTKSLEKMEWMVEKLSEIGVDKISFIYTKNSERKKIRINRLKKKSISAMKQSNSFTKTKINDIVSFDDFIKNLNDKSEKLIAHIGNNPLLKKVVIKSNNYTILVGPEGDFSKKEVSEANAKGFRGISLGKNILRTETAGLLSCYSLIELLN